MTAAGYGSRGLPYINTMYYMDRITCRVRQSTKYHINEKTVSNYTQIPLLFRVSGPRTKANECFIL
jgi:hypothetical protein